MTKLLHVDVDCVLSNLVVAVMHVIDEVLDVNSVEAFMQIIQFGVVYRVDCLCCLINNDAVYSVGV